uniref:Uncharacterized protein n=1 Tax=Arundo donax TaxID=35708 RepID=A0A0A9AMV1_ARUDO
MAEPLRSSPEPELLPAAVSWLLPGCPSWLPQSRLGRRMSSRGHGHAEHGPSEPLLQAWRIGQPHPVRHSRIGDFNLVASIQL